MLNLRYFDDNLPLQRQADIFRRNERKRLARAALQRDEVERQPQPGPRRPSHWPARPRFGLPWG